MGTALIITNETRELFFEANESIGADYELEQRSIGQLVGHLSIRCAQPDVREKYEAYSVSGSELGFYPLQSDGYAQSFDALHDEDDLYEHWSRLGVVVGRQVAAPELCVRAIQQVKHVVTELSGGLCDLEQPGTYGGLPVDANGTPILTRGFFEVYHDDSLAQLRQSLRTYLHHVVLWGKPDLWTTFDRFGVKLPGHVESAALPLHVDQNPKQHSNFKTVQGVLALDDCPVERGTLRTVPGSKTYFNDYLPMAAGHGEYVELNTASSLAEAMQAHVQPIPIKQGDLVSWDSRTTHANTANLSPLTRYVALIAAGPAQEHNPAAVTARDEAFRSGLGSNVREALMHASMRPRYTDEAAVNSVRAAERLSPLGRLLYGQERYSEA